MLFNNASESSLIARFSIFKNVMKRNSLNFPEYQSKKSWLFRGKTYEACKAHLTVNGSFYRNFEHWLCSKQARWSMDSQFSKRKWEEFLWTFAIAERKNHQNTVVNLAPLRVLQNHQFGTSISRLRFDRALVNSLIARFSIFKKIMKGKKHIFWKNQTK